MPELPEVQSVVSALAPLLPGRVIERVELRNKSTASGSPKLLETLTGQTILGLRRRGKYILMDCSNGLGVALHLRMTGWLGLLDPEEIKDTTSGINKFARVVWHLSKNKVLVFRDIRKFGRVWCGTQTELTAHPALAKLGPEPLEITIDEFVPRLLERRGRLKSVLLDQEFLAGLGNIYVDESLHAAKLHPLREAARVKPDQARKLHAEIQRLLKLALAAGGSSIDDYLHPDGSRGLVSARAKGVWPRRRAVQDLQDKD